MQEKLLLGVDGGNTKTDFLLFTQFGKCLAYLRTGTSSHEALPGGYEEAAQRLEERIEQLCLLAGCNPQDIDSAVFGMAGADTKEQHVKLYEIVDRLLPGKAYVCNDSMLGIMAAVPNGIGVCCINGTGTVVGGVNAEGRTLQVGGFGFLSSDFGGGYYLALEVLRQVYSARYRDGEPTMLTKGTLDLLGVDADSNFDLLELFHPNYLSIDKKLQYELDKMIFQCAKEGDKVAQSILHEMAYTLAQSTSGCIKDLQFHEYVTVVLAGSLWVKGDYKEMLQKYCEEVRRRVPCKCEFVVLKEPPAIGAVLEAYRRLTKQIPSIGLCNSFFTEVERKVL